LGAAPYTRRIELKYDDTLVILNIVQARITELKYNVTLVILNMVQAGSNPDKLVKRVVS
jgi:hypothetical protein